ncbi:hypothetical protein [Geminicoccus roseus]|uniref:hypothetical protein n=1 Tax=Geminicoccus roseus TaxID=404900 RepID=UPI000403AE49|nr:hypothetical protein [Geminicoccus roseus]
MLLQSDSNGFPPGDQVGSGRAERGTEADPNADGDPSPGALAPAFQASAQAV